MRLMEKKQSLGAKLMECLVCGAIFTVILIVVSLVFLAVVVGFVAPPGSLENDAFWLGVLPTVPWMALGMFVSMTVAVATKVFSRKSS